MIKFNKHNIVDTETGIKARVYYRFGKDRFGRTIITIYEKDCGRNLLKIFDTAANDSDMMIDYYESSKVSFYENDKHFSAALKPAFAWYLHWELLAQKRDDEHRRTRAA